MVEWKTVKIQLDSRVIRLHKQEDFCEALSYFLKNCLDLPERHLRNEDICKVLVILFPKINQFTWDKRFITFAQMGIYP